jgi:hypothetical protein
MMHASRKQTGNTKTQMTTKTASATKPTPNVDRSRGTSPARSPVADGGRGGGDEDLASRFSVTPVTVRQLHAICSSFTGSSESPDEDGQPGACEGSAFARDDGRSSSVLYYKGKQIYKVKLCVKLGATIANNTLADLVNVEDATGQVACFFYKKTDAVDGRLSPSAAAVSSSSPVVVSSVITPGKYHVVVGTLRELKTTRGNPGTKIHVDVVGHREMTDMNELTHHFLDCIYQDALQTRAAANALGGAPVSSRAPGGGGGAGVVSQNCFF